MGKSDLEILLCHSVCTMINNICNRDHKYAAKLYFTQNKISEYKIKINKCLSVINFGFGFGI